MSKSPLVLTGLSPMQRPAPDRCAPTRARFSSRALGDAHRWLDELMSDPRQTLESLAWRECKTERSIRMTLSLAFLAPDVVKAGVEGRLPRGYGLKGIVTALKACGVLDGGVAQRG